MSDISLSYEVEELASGEAWSFRFPADDETALWQGPFPTVKAAHDAAQEFISNLMAFHAAELLGLN